MSISQESISKMIEDQTTSLDELLKAESFNGWVGLEFQTLDIMTHIMILTIQRIERSGQKLLLKLAMEMEDIGLQRMKIQMIGMLY